MADIKHFDTQAGSPPYKNLFHTVSLVPPNTSLAFISTQWAADPATGKLVEGTEGDVHKQAKVIWANIVGILKELGAEMKDVVHRTVNFIEFDEEKGKAAVMGSMESIPDEWKPDAFASSLKYNGVKHFHEPGIVYAVELIVAVPNRK